MNVDLGVGHWWFGSLIVARRADAAALAPVTLLLTGYGLTAELVEHHRRPVLVVANNIAGAASGPWTAVYLADHPVWAEPAVYGFVDLCLGPLTEPGRVAARLAWLLGVAGSRHCRINPAQEGVGHDT